MAMPLDQWQKRLEGHFRELASARSTVDSPIFALEHGLNEDELDEIGILLRARLRENMWLAGHWLAWVIYATEFGYDYEGDEYWPSFESYTPGWREKVSRNQLRTWFAKFQITYGGVKPSGTWAAQFPIIAWPITHAILPKYLQWQFAKSLYDLRYQLAGLNALSPESIGHLLTQNAWDASSRFRVFLQQEELAGRIVLALLGDAATEAPSPIHLPALKRLASDLQRVQSSREWLNETRRFVADRLKGAACKPSDPANEHEGHSDKPKDKVTLGMRPTLMLRPSGKMTWAPVLDIPSFTAVGRITSELRTFLARTWCKIAGTGEAWRPAGWLLSHNQKCLLKSWPGAGAALMQFERDNPVLNHLIEQEARLSQGPTWLCKRGDDGLAYEITGRTVRPRQNYILLSEKPLPTGEFFSECRVDCNGLNAASFAAPAVFSGNLVRALEDIGLHVAKTVRIWPAGLSARQWDGEGYSEWLTTDAPCFGIVHDHPLDGYLLRLDNGAESFIKASGNSTPSFVSLPALAPGRHILSVKACQPSSNPGRFPAPLEGVVILEVREPTAWVPGTTSHAGLTVSLEPFDPSLDVFWDGDVALSVLGPTGRQVTCSLSLSSAAGKELLNEQIGVFDLPVSNDAWQGKLSQFLVPDARTFAYLEAASGRLTVKGDELGEFIARLDRDIKPVRWNCRGVHGLMTIRLNDDTGHDAAAIGTFRSFLHPSRAGVLEADRLHTGFEVSGVGGLYEARNGDFSDIIVASTPRIEGGLQGLLIEPDLQDLESQAVNITHLLELIRTWADARLVGPLVHLRHNRIITRLATCFFSRVCGSRWAAAETAYLTDTQSEAAQQQLQRLVGSPGFAAVLRRDCNRMQQGTIAGKAWFADVAHRYGVSSEAGLCEFALQLSSQPHRMLAVPAPAFDALLAEVRKNEALIRGARLVALMAIAEDTAAVKPPLPRWIW
jgi:hypothetical protein